LVNYKVYKALKNQSFRIGEYEIVPIRYEDRFLIMKWRNEQIYHLRQSSPLKPTDQDYYFNNVVNKLFTQIQPDQILFSYLYNGDCIGYGGLVHINWANKDAELSFIMDTSLELKNFSLHWSIFLSLIQSVAFDELALNKIYTFAFDLRPHLYAVLEDAGFAKESVIKNQYLFNNNFIDVIIHSKYSSDV
jgi:RimJ/RimL family protein N-acetyltransferase